MGLDAGRVGLEDKVHAADVLGTCRKAEGGRNLAAAEPVVEVE